MSRARLDGQNKKKIEQGYLNSSKIDVDFKPIFCH